MRRTVSCARYVGWCWGKRDAVWNRSASTRGTAAHYTVLSRTAYIEWVACVVLASRSIENCHHLLAEIPLNPLILDGLLEVRSLPILTNHDYSHEAGCVVDKVAPVPLHVYSPLHKIACPGRFSNVPVGFKAPTKS